MVVAASEIASQSTQTTPILIGRRLIEVFSVGKELFLVFSSRNAEERIDDNPDDIKEVALRLHFGMNGCLSLSKEDAPSRVPHWRKEPLSLKITLRSPNETGHSTGNGKVLETVSSKTSFVSAFVARSKLSRLARLDTCSDKFDPNAVLEALRTRSSAMISDAVLDQNRFPGVGNIIKIEGLHLARVHPRRIMSSLSDQELRDCIHHCRVYAMGWLSSGRAPTKKVYNKTICGTCHAGMVRMMKIGNCLSRTTFWCEVCQVEKVDEMFQSNEKKRGIDVIPDTNTNKGMLPPRKRPKLLTSNDTFTQESLVKTRTPVYCCSQHGPSTLLLKRVRKTDSSNRNRLFRLCNVRGCQFFSWADSHLPLCSCRKKSILRVSKTERTGGRWFICCAAGGSKEKSSASQSGKECRLFSWAKPEHLGPLGNSLTPLL
jgi:formamidopyrimidine-DNA glycosylase